MWDLWWIKEELGQVSSASHSSDCPTLIVIHFPSSGAGIIGQIVTDVPSAVSLTSPQKKTMDKFSFCRDVRTN
jgi:hypothetical protein